MSHLPEDPEDTVRNLLGSLPERWGRMDLMSRLALAQVGLALRDKNLLDEESHTLKSGWTGGLIIGSEKGSLAIDLEYARTVKEGPGMASPHLFGYTLPNIPLAEAAIQYRLTGPVFSLISDNPYEDAKREARQWLPDMPDNKNIIVAGALDVFPDRESSKTIAKFNILQN